MPICVGGEQHSSKTFAPKCLQPGAVTTRRTWHRLKAPCSRLTTVLAGGPLAAVDNSSTQVFLQSEHRFPLGHDGLPCERKKLVVGFCHSYHAALG